VLDPRFSNGQIDAAGLEVTLSQEDTAALGVNDGGDTDQASGGVGRISEDNDRNDDATDDSILANGRGVGVRGLCGGGEGDNVAVKGVEGGGGHGEGDQKMGGRESGGGGSGSDDEDEKKKAGGEEWEEKVQKEEGGQSADVCEVDKSSKTQSDNTAGSRTGPERGGLEIDEQRTKPSLLQARKPTVDKNRGGGEGDGGKGGGGVGKELGRGCGGDKDAFERKRVGSNDENAAARGEGAAEKKKQRQQKQQLPEELQPKPPLPPAPLQVPLEAVLHVVPQ